MNLAIVIGNEYCVFIDSTISGYLKCVGASLENISMRCSNLFNSIRYLSREYKIYFSIKYIYQKNYVMTRIVLHNAAFVT